MQALIDGSDANTATIAQSYLLAIVNQFVRGRAGPCCRRPRRRPPCRSRCASRIWYNPELKSVNFIVPGVIAVIMMIVGAILTALSIVKEKERGTIEQILVSPIRPLEMMIGKLVPYVIIALHRSGIIISAGYLIFGCPSRAASSSSRSSPCSTSSASLGVGVFVSTIADTMQSAMLAAIFISLLPSVLLSGFVFPLEDMPVVIRAISYSFPGRYFVTAIRGIYLKGVGLEVLWPQALMLLVFTAGIVWLQRQSLQREARMTASLLARIAHVVWKEVIQIGRDRRMFGLILLMPLMELFIFGYVVASDLTNIELAVCDYDQSAESRTYVDQVLRSGYFRIAAPCGTIADVNQLLDAGRVKVALVIPPDFSGAHQAAAARRGDGGGGRQQLEHRDDRRRLPRADHRRARRRRAVRRSRAGPSAPRSIRSSPSSRASGSTPSCAACASWCRRIICVLLMESLVILTAIAIVQGEGARHDGAAHRDADPPVRAHPRQGDPVRRPRLRQRHRRAAGRHVLVRRRHQRQRAAAATRSPACSSSRASAWDCWRRRSPTRSSRRR